MPTKRRRKPQEAEPTPLRAGDVDEKMIGDAISKIGGILQSTLFKAVADVGDYVFHHFFHDDPVLVISKDPHKTASFRALTERCGSEIPVSKSWLHNAVSIAVMRRALPEGANYHQLSSTHQTALLPLRNPERAEKLAKRAFDKKLSVTQLKHVVHEELEKTRDDESQRGRPRMPTITRTLGRAIKVFTVDGAKLSFTKALLDELDDDGVAQAVKDAQGLIDRLTSLVEKLGSRS